jgi:hypothetical protein
VQPVRGLRFIAYIQCATRCCAETEGHVATPNYGYEKRQKELAKKRKKEEKLKAKAERKAGEAGGTGGPADEDATDAGGEPPALPPQT